MGGYKVLQLRDSVQVPDVSGLSWIDPHTLVYSVSPIYGRPGIYVYDCIDKRIRRIVAPTNTDSRYPDGTDYFELKDIRKGGVIYFYYAPDVDQVDFRTFRSRRFVYRVWADGSGMRKVAPGSRD
jgi:hypothetical protein